MRFGDFWCPICKTLSRHWEPKMVQCCHKPECVAQNLVDGIPTPVEMDLLSYGSVTPKFSITIDV